MYLILPVDFVNKYAMTPATKTSTKIQHTIVPYFQLKIVLFPKTFFRVGMRTSGDMFTENGDGEYSSSSSGNT